MSNPISRRKFVGHVAALGAAAGGLAITGSARAEANPDPEFIKKAGKGWKVLPSGMDDQPNLEWALRNTAPGRTVRLDAGVYKLGCTVVVPDFDGKLIGAGSDQTTITCTDEYSYEVWESPGGGKDLGEPKPQGFPRVPLEGSSTRVWPALLFFYKTPVQNGEDPLDRANRIEVRGIRCRGSMLGDYWCFGDEAVLVTIINSMDWHHPESTPATTRQDVMLYDIEVDGYESSEFGPYGTSCACVTVLGGVILTDNFDLEGSVDGDAIGLANGALLGFTPAEGDVTISNCLFRNCRLGPGIVGLSDGKLLMENIVTDNCLNNCLQLVDNSNCNMVVRDNDLFCNSFLLPPEWTIGGATDVPSSLGCVVVIQGMAAALGIPQNVRWLSLAHDEAAHAAHPEAGPLGTWRPMGPALAPAASPLKIRDVACRSSETANTYCLHVVDAANLAFGTPTVDVSLKGNACEDSFTCVSLEHIEQGEVKNNECASQAFGVELHNSPNVQIIGNDFSFPPGDPGCEIRELSLGDKIDFSRTLAGAGACSAQG
jgi:hypothetical protein